MADELDARTRLTEALWNDPETRPMLEAATKKKFPHVNLPSHDLRQQRDETLEEIKKQREAVAADKAKLDSGRSLRDARAEIMNDPDLRIQPEEIEAVEKLMEERLIGTHKTAARLHRLEQAQSIGMPRSAGPTVLEIPGVRG